MAHFCKKEKKWRGSICINGKRYTKFGFSSKKYAELWEAQIRHKHERKILDLGINDNFCISLLAEKYLEYCQKFKKLRSADREKTSLNNFKNFCHPLFYALQVLRTKAGSANAHWLAVLFLCKNKTSLH